PKAAQAKAAAVAKPGAKAAAKPVLPANAPAGRRIVLGEITVPSGHLAIFDVGLVGYLPRPALEPAIVKATVPADRPLAVTGVSVGKGRFGDCWDHVAI